MRAARASPATRGSARTASSIPRSDATARSDPTTCRRCPLHLFPRLLLCGHKAPAAAARDARRVLVFLAFVSCEVRREVLVFPPLQGRHGLVGREPHRRCRSPAAGRSRACASTPRCRWASRRCPWSKPSTCVCARAATAAAAAAVAATAATATRPCAGAGKRLRRARAAVPEATRVILDGSKASTAMCRRRAGGSAPAAKSVAVETMTSATRRSRRSGDGAHELFRPPNADGIVPHLILGIF